MAQIWTASYKNCTVQGGSALEEIALQKVEKTEPKIVDTVKMSDLQDLSFDTSFSSVKNISIHESDSRLSPVKQINNESNTTLIDLREKEENPTHFIELNNSNYEQSPNKSDIKLIKVRIIVPKGTFNNSKFDHKSNVLNIVNDVNKLSFNIKGGPEISSDNIKITNILKSNTDCKIKHKDIDAEQNDAYQNKPKSYPVMGTNALLAKSNSAKNTDHKYKLNEADVIKELVSERFQDCMIELYQRNFRRQTSRRSSLQNSGTISEASEDRDMNTNLTWNIRHSSTINEPEDLMENLSIKSPSVEYLTIVENDTQETFVVEPPVQIRTSQIVSEDDKLKLQKSFDSSDFNVDVTLGSTIDFILSTDGNGLERNCEDPLISKVSANSNMDTPQSRSDFDEDKFLERALGEELNGYHSTNSGLDKAGSSGTNTNDASLVSSKSIGSSDISVLLSKASSLYSTVSSKIRRLSKKLPSEGTISEEEDMDRTGSECVPLSERMSRLMQESVVQYQVMRQTSKALGYCATVKEFVGSVEMVEAERMLLLAICKRQAILDIIGKLEYDDCYCDDTQSRGTVTIANLNFLPREASPKSKANRMVNRKRTESTQWFVCVVNCNEFTYATQAAMADKDGFVRFNDERFEFEDLGSDFHVNVSLYAMKVKNNMRNYSHESKFHLKKDIKTMCPPTGSSFLHHLTHSSSTHHTTSSTSPTKHSFLPWGTTTLRLSQLTRPSTDTYRLTKVPSTSALGGQFTAEVAARVDIQTRGAGFVTVGAGTAGGETAWSRHWCEMQGAVLRWWNYPGEVGETEPLGAIDLSCCVTATIDSVDRNICARPRTLLLETTADQDGGKCRYNNSKANYKIVRHLLSCDTAHELRIWEKKLNDVVATLRSWNAMTSKLYFKRE